MSATSDRLLKFLSLVERVHACRKCPRMHHSARVLGLGCGPLEAPVLFVGEAPGRLGADESRVPFHGDKAGHNFESLIDQVGVNRYEVFVTNAVLCNPRDEWGNNSTPNTTEISNCSAFLKEQLEIVDPKNVVTLGATALKACSLVSSHDLSLKSSVRTANYWFGRTLIPLYHPGQRAMLHRSFSNQLADYQFVAEQSRRSTTGRIRKRATGNRNSSTTKLAYVSRRILEKSPQGISYFALHKLLFLTEVAYLEATGERLTSAYIVRQKDGPYCVDLHVARLPTTIPDVCIIRSKGSVQLRLESQLSLAGAQIALGLTAEEIDVVDRTIARYGALADAELKRVSYLSSPMRELLRKEKSMRANFFNAAVLPYRADG